MRNTVFGLLLVAGSFAGLAGSPVASADTTLITTPPTACTEVSGSSVIGGDTTECSSPGNVQLNATPEVPEYPYPWNDELYGPALIIGGGGYGPPAPAPAPAPAPHGGGGR